jgi:hypothetical protein
MILARVGKYRINMEKISYVLEADEDVFVCFAGDDDGFVKLKQPEAGALLRYLDARIVHQVITEDNP